ncbi:MAG: tetratricopeptide repeat protein [Candidatus Eisenbacteria bacterium]|uniref:Tetratricopeptide repeat protein n=1 Tax=Eiseniibacteriota bacterium TaxID=2212470 RepID=A0A7Y2E8H0_UNCEI|nr:tetratricopeptide repeat protein [Candidatus Eisenbacteria bacterium]
MAWLMLARLRYNEGEYELATELLEKAKANRDALTGLEQHFISILEARLARDDDALQAMITQLILDYPDNVEALCFAANRAFFKGDTEEAVVLYERILRDFPHRGEAYNMIGYAKAELEEWDASVEAFQKYTFLYPDQPNPHDSLGELYLRTGRYDEALSEFEKAIQIKHDFGWAWYHRAQALFATGRFMEALECIAEGREAAPGSPTDAGWSRTEAVVHIHRGDITAGHDLMNETISAHPNMASNFFISCRLYAEEGKLDLARERLQDFIEIAYKDASEEKLEKMRDDYAYNELSAFIAMQDGDWELALKHLTAADGKSEAWWLAERVRYERMQALVELGRATEALEYAKDEIFTINPVQSNANYWAGRANEDLGAFEEAIKYYDRVLNVLNLADRDHPLVEDAQERKEKLLTTS